MPTVSVLMMIGRSAEVIINIYIIIVAKTGFVFGMRTFCLYTQVLTTNS